MIKLASPLARGIAIGLAAAASLVGSFALGSALSAAPAAGSPRAGGVLLAASAADGKITVTGTGTVAGTPDQVILSMGVQTHAPSVSVALAEASADARRVIRALRGGGVAAADIQTSGLSIQPDYRSGSPTPAGYGASEELTARLRDLSKAGSQIQAAATAGGDATTVSGISLGMSDTSALLKKARTAAVRDAQAKAGEFAAALGRPLARVISLSVQDTSVPLFAESATAFKAASVPVSPGRQQVSVQITVVYALG